MWNGFSAEKMSAASLLAPPKSGVLEGSFVMKWDEAIKEFEIRPEDQKPPLVRRQ
jgi:hypothetical protein